MSFEDLLEDLDESYKNIGSGSGGGFVTQEELLAGFEGKFIGHEKVETNFGPSTHWKFEDKEGNLRILNRPHHREDPKTKKVKPTRFFISFLNAKIEEGNLVRIKQTGSGMNTEYQIEKPKV